MPASASILRRFAYNKRGNALYSSLRYLLRARLATLLTLIVIAVALALPVIFALLILNLREVDVSSEEANSLTLYLHTRINDFRGVELAGEIQKRSDILSTHYISRDEALETFNRHFALADATEALEENPLPGAIVAVMQTRDEDETRIRLLADELQNIPEIELVKYDLRWLQRLNALLNLITRGTGLIAILLVITTALVIGNTIRLEMLRRADEIKVAHQIGASMADIRRPFLYSGLIYGLLGGCLATLLVSVVTHALQQPVQNLAALYGNTFIIKHLTVTQVFSLMIFASLLSLCTAWLALRWQIQSIMTQRS